MISFFINLNDNIEKVNFKEHKTLEMMLAELPPFGRFHHEIMKKTQTKYIFNQYL